MDANEQRMALGMECRRAITLLEKTLLTEQPEVAAVLWKRLGESVLDWHDRQVAEFHKEFVHLAGQPFTWTQLQEFGLTVQPCDDRSAHKWHVWEGRLCGGHAFDRT